MWKWETACRKDIKACDYRKLYLEFAYANWLVPVMTLIYSGLIIYTLPQVKNIRFEVFPACSARMIQVQNLNNSLKFGFQGNSTLITKLAVNTSTLSF